MQNRSMGVGRAGGARRGRSTFHLLFSDRMKPHLDTCTWRSWMGKALAKVRMALVPTERKVKPSPKELGWGQGWAVLQQAEQWPSSEMRQILCQVDSGLVIGAELLSHSAELSKSHFVHLLRPRSNLPWNRTQDSWELCCENEVLAEYARGDHVEGLVLSSRSSESIAEYPWNTEIEKLVLFHSGVFSKFLAFCFAHPIH